MAKNLQKLARLAINDKFLKEFNRNFNGFEYYGNDIQIILDEAIQLGTKLKAVKSAVNDIFGNLLPTVVKRKLEDYLTVENLPNY